MRPPNMALRPKSRIFVERRGAQKDIWRFLTPCNKLTATDRTKESSFARRRFIGSQLVLAGKPPKVLARDPPGRRERGGVCLSTRYAMTMPKRVETRNFIRYGPAMTAALHLGFPVFELGEAAGACHSCIRCSFGGSTPVTLPSLMFYLHHDICLSGWGKGCFVGRKALCQEFTARMPGVDNVDGKIRNAVNAFHQLKH